MSDSRTWTRRSVLAGGAVGLAGLAGCAGDSAAPEPDENYDVGMTAIDFRPERLEVRPGTEVVWRNTNTRKHTVTAYEETIPDEASYFASGGFESQRAAEDAYDSRLAGGIESGRTFRHTFEVPGEYGYFCIPHVNAKMEGVVVVSEDAPTKS